MKKTARIIALIFGSVLSLGGFLLLIAGLLYSSSANTPQNLQNNEFSDLGVVAGRWVAGAGIAAMLIGIAILAVGRHLPPRDRTKPNTWKTP